MLYSESGADVTFEFLGGEIKAHKSILAVRVPYFERLFASSASPTRIKVDNTCVQDFRSFLRFVYSGRLVEPFVMEEILLLAKKYGVPGLMKACAGKVKKDWYGTLGLEAQIQVIANKLQFARSLELVAFKEEIEKLLLSRVRDLNYLIRRRASEPFCAAPMSEVEEKKHDDILDEVVGLLVLAHDEECKELKACCFNHLEIHVCDFQSYGSQRRLKTHPDLLLEMVRWYRVNGREKERQAGDAS